MLFLGIKSRNIFCLNLIGHMLAPPIADCFYNRIQGFTVFREAVFCFGRNHRVHFTMYDAIGFQFTQLLRQHFGSGLRQKAPQFTETQRAIDKMPENNSFIFTAYDGKGCLDGTVKTGFFMHMKNPFWFCDVFCNATAHDIATRNPFNQHRSEAGERTSCLKSYYNAIISNLKEWLD